MHSSLHRQQPKCLFFKSHRAFLINPAIYFPLLLRAWVFFFVLCPVVIQGKGRYDWMGWDKFDEIDARLRAVDHTNCHAKSKDQLMLPKSVVSQLPVYNQLLSRTWYRNRTTLIHLHNMALNRAFFYSYILQRMNTTDTFKVQPGWMYFYFSTTADINANPAMINGSGIFFDMNCHYPNWYSTTPFNRTLPLFGPRAHRQDNWKNQGNFLREPTRTSTEVRDLGAGNNANYTRSAHKMNPWYGNWLPDLTGEMDSLVKFSYHIGIKKSDKPGSFRTDNYEAFSFFGPASPGANEKDERKLPVVFTPPYFDCGHSNKWIVSAVAPVVDFMPRYSTFVHLRRPRFVATISMDTDFVETDFNPCSLGDGNPGPSYLSGIHRCKSSTTHCLQKAGLGFKRGSYTCACNSGTRYPWWLQPPYDGEEIERATQKEYNAGYSCSPVQYQQAMPLIDGTPTVEVEGGDSPLNSGGLNLRKRRAQDNITRKDTDYHREGDIPRKKLSREEILDFADRLREITPEDLELFRKGLLLPFDDDVSVTPEDVEEEHAIKNDMDWEVERMYQSDLRDHENLQRSLLSLDKTGNGNATMITLSSAIRDSAKSIRQKHMERFQADQGGRSNTRSRRRRNKRASAFDQQSFDRMMQILRQKSSVTRENCHSQPSHRLVLPGDTAYGVHKQFEPEGRTALRLAHFLSGYLQMASPDDNFGNLLGGGRIHHDQIFGEVMANVMGNFRIVSAGAYFDKGRFENQDGSARELFGPFAFKKEGSFYAYDSAGLKESYLNSEWFVRAKARFGANFSGLKGYPCWSRIRSDSQGTMRVKHEYWPMVYKTATYERGFWSAPYFRCDGDVNAWVIQYVVPFFGLDLFKKLQFRGVTTVEVPLDLLEINQCPQPFTVPNAFKNTARCDYFSTTCSPQPGLYFRRGAYRCDCRLGFEYWSADGKYFFEGSYVEGEYERKRRGITNRFDDLYCRASSGSRQESRFLEVLGTWLLLFSLHRIRHLILC